MNIQKILVVEDQRLFREFVCGWVKKSGYRLAGEASGIRQAERILGRKKVDLILLDLDLPDGDTLSFIERHTEERPTTFILVLTAHAGNYPVLRLKRSGVMGILDKKEACGEELEKAVKEIEQWRTYYSEGVEQTFQNLIREGEAFYKTLSPREVEMVKYFGLGYSNDWVAQHLGLSVATIQGHRRNVMSKIVVRSTPELIIWAIQNGFVNGSEIGRLQETK